MNNEDRQVKMMDYLYGEMSVTERREYEAWLDQHPEVRQEIEAMQDSRQWLQTVEEVRPEPLVIDLAGKKAIDRRWWYRIGAVAASLLLLWLFNFQIRTDQGGVILSFGHPENLQPAGETPLPVTDAIPSEVWEAFLAGNQELLDRKLVQLDSSWQYQFTNLQKEQQQQWRRVRNTQAQQVEQISKAFAERQLPRLAGLMQQLQMEQQEELQLLLVEFWNTWQETRQTDLERIDYRMTNLYQNVERNQQETEARVVDYIQRVGGR